MLAADIGARAQGVLVHDHRMVINKLIIILPPVDRERAGIADGGSATRTQVEPNHGSLVAVGNVYQGCAQAQSVAEFTDLTVGEDVRERRTGGLLAVVLPRRIAAHDLAGIAVLPAVLIAKHQGVLAKNA